MPMSHPSTSRRLYAGGLNEALERDMQTAGVKPAARKAVLTACRQA